MFVLKIIISFLVIYICESATRECFDCTQIASCKGAFEAAKTRNTEAQEKIRNAFCGYDILGTKKIPKVCCSDFSATSKDAIETHSNIKLLPESCGGIDGERIIGGRIAKLYEFPWMALISFRTQNGLQFECAGSIINSRYILTAAHCVKDKNIAGIRIGEYDIRYKTDCQGEYPLNICESHIQDMRVDESVPHPSYTGLPTVQNDIALIRLKKSINLTYRNAAPICLPLSASLRNENLDRKQATVAGWGFTETGRDSSVLLKVEIPILPASECRNLYNKNPGPQEEDRVDKEFCAGELNKDSCSGDSGGPLMLERSYNGTIRVVQYGIVSFGPRQCGSHYPGVYTDVTKYMDWILDNLKP